MRKLWYIYTMECYSVIKKNTFESGVQQGTINFHLCLLFIHSTNI